MRQGRDTPGRGYTTLTIISMSALSPPPEGAPDNPLRREPFTTRELMTCPIRQTDDLLEDR